MLCLIDSNIFLCLAFEDSGHQHCGELLDEAFRGAFTPLISSIQIAEIYTPFLRAGDDDGLRKMKREILKLDPRISVVSREIAERVAEYRATIKTPEGRWLALADSIILATAILEGAESLYTLDTDFANVDLIRVRAPQMEIEEWVGKYGIEQQRKVFKS